MSCKCQQCGKQYKIDLIVAGTIWKAIKPAGSAPEAGLRCPSCIMNNIATLYENLDIKYAKDYGFNENGVGYATFKLERVW